MAAQCGVKVAPSIPSIPISSGLVGVEPAQVVLAEAEGAGLGDLGQCPARCTSVRAGHGPSLGEVAVDPLGPRVAPTTSTVSCMARRMARMASMP